MSCEHNKLTKHGKDRKGCQRWKCANCGTTVTNDSHKRPLASMRIDPDKAAAVLGMLLEGMSIRAVERTTGMNRDTICDLVLLAGENCDRFLCDRVTGIKADAIELDEIWGFVTAKQKTANARNLGPDAGDAWTWLAIDADTKLILSHATGKRDDDTCHRFLVRLNAATVGQCQVTSDGLASYTHNVPYYLGTRIDFAQLIKTYKSTQSETRYSPAEITGIEKVVRMGNPQEDRISTSYSERLNLSVRMHNRRMTRLTNAHSKSAAHHAAMQSLFAAWYNFCRSNLALRVKGEPKRTPAMAAGLADKVWTLGELLAAAA
jgi:transposase-like protein/IS1 family transposase